MTTTLRSIDAFGDVSKPCRALARRDPALRAALKAIGAPHIRRRPGGFEGLFRIIVEQQVSVPSAQAIWKRCEAAFDKIEAGAALALGEKGLRSLGLSGPKARYVLALAEAVEAGAIDLAALSRADDAGAHQTLVSLKGVGPWSAAIYLLFCEGRVDIWPPGDVALQAAYGAAAGRDGRVAARALDEAAAQWAPWRGLAAHILWTYYAHIRGRTPI
ncbi:MAG: DNA-3-methyladenine glycosylase 2 family protein [Alphaproteobacteria bacterium]|nr:DNA-3-methyladenine glycosylase 2 family protein [Alphaproteobacteria bacterium]